MSTATLPPADARQELYRVMRKEASFEEKAEHALRLGMEYLGVENAYLTRIDQDTSHWQTLISTDSPDGQFPPGLEVNLGETFCRQTIESDTPITISNATEQGWDGDPAFEEHRHHCYHGAALRPANDPFGTICFVNEDPNPDGFSEAETMFTELITRLLERELEREQYTSQLTRQSNLFTVLNRVLRHNLRNDMAVIRGYTEMMKMNSQNDENAAVALEKIDSLLEVSDKARELTQIVGSSADRQITNIDDLVGEIVEEFRTEYPNATFDMELDENVTAAVFPTFDRALRELIENAAKHTGPSPTVEVIVKRVPNAVDIHISDNGPGLPEQDQEVFTGSSETQMSHGSGLGLWTVHWIVEGLGGSTESTVTEDGTVLTISVPRGPKVELENTRSELEHAKTRFESAFHRSTEAMVILNDDGQIIEANPQAQEIFGLDPKELLGRSATEFFLDDSELHRNLAPSYDDDRAIDTAEVIRADGQSRHVEYAARPEIIPGEHFVIFRDVTEQEQHKRELRETKQRLDLALQGSDTGVWDYNMDTNEVLWDETVERLFGIESDEFEGTLDAFIERVHSDDRDKLKSAIQTAIKEDEQFESEYRIPRDDGEQRWVRARGGIFSDDGSERMVGIVTDISERKENERKITKFESAVEASGHAIFITDVDGTIEYVNEAFEEITGYAATEAIGRTPQILDSGEVPDAHFESLWETILKGDVFQEKIINQRKDGSRYHANQTIAPITDESGEILAFVAVHNDVTEAKECERELRSLKEQYETLLDAARDPVFAVDAETGEILETNGAAETLIGEPQENIIGRHHSSLHPAAKTELYQEVFNRAREERMRVQRLPDGSQPELVTADDDRIPIEISVNTASLPDGTVMFGTFRDVELKREKERLDAVTSTLSHDLRNPLNVAQARLQLLNDEFQSEHIEPIITAHNRIETLIEDVLTLARNGDPVDETEPVVLSDFVDTCLEGVETAGATLVVETEQTVQAEETRLKQLVKNILRNAIDHIGEDVTITVGDLDDGFYIADDGPGIPIDERDQIFEFGYSSTTKGTGLGLAIVQEITKAHDWEISVTDSDFGGARFEITGVAIDAV